MDISNSLKNALVYELAIVEDKNILPEDVMALQTFSIKSHKLDDHQANILKGCYRAIDFILARNKLNVKAQMNDMFELNKYIDHYENPKAGQLRTKKLKEENYGFDAPNWTMDTVTSLFDGLEQLNSTLELCQLLLKLTKAQLFDNGNKRTALSFVNLCCLKKGLPLIRITNLDKYFNALKLYYQDDQNLSKASDILVQMQEKAHKKQQ